MNGTCVLPDKDELKSSDLKFFVHTFAEKEIKTTPVLHNPQDVLFEFDLKDYKITSNTMSKTLMIVLLQALLS